MVEGDHSKVIGHKLGIPARTAEVQRVRVTENAIEKYDGAHPLLSGHIGQLTLRTV
jgi:hypothetical protein